MEKQPSAISWVLSQAGEHKNQYVVSVVLAILGVACSVAPFFVITKIVQGIMEGQKELSFYVTQCLVMAVFWMLRVLFHALSTAASHRATFAVLGEMRKRATEKLTQVPLGVVLDRSSGALKNILVERIDSIETILAHIVPEFTANLLIPVVMMVYIFSIDWRMGLAALASFPLGMFCYVGMMLTSAGFYERTVVATKELNNEIIVLGSCKNTQESTMLENTLPVSDIASATTEPL